MRLARASLLCLLALMSACAATPRAATETPPRADLLCWTPAGHAAEHKRFRAWLGERCGGWTCWPVEGGWIDPQGVAVVEPGVMYLLSCSDRPEDLPAELDRWVTTEFKQQASYIVPLARD